MSMFVNSTSQCDRGVSYNTAAGQYSSALNVHLSATDCPRGTVANCVSSSGRIPQPPVSAPKEFRQPANQICRNSAPDPSFRQRSETVADVQQLRDQVKMLSHELRQLRSEFTGSVQHLHTIDEGAAFAPIMHQNLPIKHLSASVMGLESSDSTVWNGRQQSVKPPLPPRLYRPAKPQRTFAHGSTSILNLPSEYSGPMSPPPMSSAHCSSVHSSFRSNARAPVMPTLHSSHSSLFKPAAIPPLRVDPSECESAPPPPPPRLGVSRSRSSQFPATVAQNAPLPPPHLPPKPADRSRPTVNGDSPRPPAPPYQQRPMTSWVSHSRPSHIHTNGSINCHPTLSPPYQKQKQDELSYHYLASHKSNQNCCVADKDPVIPKLVHKAADSRKKINLDVMESLAQSGGGPLTNDNLVRSLENGFQKGVCWYELGPAFLFLNPYNDVASPPILSMLKEAPKPVKALAEDLRARFFESELSQAVVFSGNRGSGKTYLTVQLLNELFRLFCNDRSQQSTENVIYKQFDATMTLIRSLTSVSRDDGQTYASQAASIYELHVVDGVLYKAKTYCSLLNYHYFVKPSCDKTNFQIFYQILAGLSMEEKKKFHLLEYTTDNLNYLKRVDSSGVSLQQSEQQQHQMNKLLFCQFKSALLTLGIPFSDIMRILAAILLLGNVRFVDSESDSGELVAEELDSAAALLGITTLTLFKAVTKHERRQKGESVQLPATADSANESLSALSKTLYHRCTSAIIRRANSMKSTMRISNRAASNDFTTSNSNLSSNTRPASGISSSDESSVHDSGIGINSQSSPNEHSSGNHGIHCSSSRNSSQGLDGTISVLDWFGFSDGEHNHFEELCSNFAAEKLQQFYQAYVLKRNIKLAQHEGVHSDFDWQLLSCDGDETNIIGSDLECALPFPRLLRIFDEINDVDVENKEDLATHFNDQSTQQLKRVQDANGAIFLVARHYGGAQVAYHDIDDYPKINRDQLPASIVQLFSSQCCNFGFLSYLFATDLRRLENHSENTISPRMARIACFDNKHDNTTFGDDFSLQTEAFLKNIDGSKVRFVHCIQTNSNCEYFSSDRDRIMTQCMRLDVLPTMHMLNAGLPYAMNLKEFNDRYRFLATRYHSHTLLKQAPSLAEEVRVIVDCYLRAVDESNLPYISNNWAVGTEHMFLSEGARGQLELLRDQHLAAAARIIQGKIRSWLYKRRGNCLPADQKSLWTKMQHPDVCVTNMPVRNGMNRTSAGSSSASVVTQCNDTVQRAPSLPPARGYSVHLDKKVHFPQRRVFVENYKDASSSAYFSQNEVVTALGWGSSKNQLLIRNRLDADCIDAPTVVAVPINCTKLCIGY